MSEQPQEDPGTESTPIPDLDLAEDVDAVRGGRDPADGMPSGHRQPGK